MEELNVYFLMGPVDCNDANIPHYSAAFLERLSEAMGIRVKNGTLEEVASQELPVFFIASGGAEMGFQASYHAAKPPYILLTTPAYNSLAAAMEIMGYLDEQGEAGEILHVRSRRLQNGSACSFVLRAQSVRLTACVSAQSASPPG